MRKNALPYIAGLGTAVSASLVSFAFIEVVFAIGVGVVAGVAGGVVTRQLSPKHAPMLEDYHKDATARVKEALATTANIKALAAYVTDPQAKVALLKGCKVIPDLLATTEQKEPGSVASTAARVNVHLRGIEAALRQYLEIQRNPSYVQDAEGRLALGNQGFADFHTFALTSIQQVNENNMIGYKATLDALAPMPELNA